MASSSIEPNLQYTSCAINIRSTFLSYDGIESPEEFDVFHAKAVSEVQHSRLYTHYPEQEKKWLIDYSLWKEFMYGKFPFARPKFDLRVYKPIEKSKFKVLEIKPEIVGDAVSPHLPNSNDENGVQYQASTEDYAESLKEKAKDDNNVGPAVDTKNQSSSYGYEEIPDSQEIQSSEEILSNSSPDIELPENRNTEASDHSQLEEHDFLAGDKIDHTHSNDEEISHVKNDLGNITSPPSDAERTHFNINDKNIITIEGSQNVKGIMNLRNSHFPNGAIDENPNSNDRVAESAWSSTVELGNKAENIIEPKPFQDAPRADDNEDDSNSSDLTDIDTDSSATVKGDSSLEPFSAQENSTVLLTSAQGARENASGSVDVEMISTSEKPLESDVSKGHWGQNFKESSLVPRNSNTPIDQTSDSEGSFATEVSQDTLGSPNHAMEVDEVFHDALEDENNYASEDKNAENIDNMDVSNNSQDETEREFIEDLEEAAENLANLDSNIVESPETENDIGMDENEEAEIAKKKRKYEGEHESRAAKLKKALRFPSLEKALDQEGKTKKDAAKLASNSMNDQEKGEVVTAAFRESADTEEGIGMAQISREDEDTIETTAIDHNTEAAKQINETTVGQGEEGQSNEQKNEVKTNNIDEMKAGKKEQIKTEVRDEIKAEVKTETDIKQDFDDKMSVKLEQTIKNETDVKREVKNKTEIKGENASTTSCKSGAVVSEDGRKLGDPDNNTSPVHPDTYYQGASSSLSTLGTTIKNDPEANSETEAQMTNNISNASQTTLTSDNPHEKSDSTRNVPSHPKMQDESASNIPGASTFKFELGTAAEPKKQDKWNVYVDNAEESEAGNIVKPEWVNI